MIQSLLCYRWVHLCSIAINFQMFLTNYCYIKSSYTSPLQSNILSIIYVCIVCSADAFSKWCTIFKCCTLISFICLFCSIITSIFSNCYCSLNKYVYVSIITKLDLSISVLNLISLLVYVPLYSSFISTQFLVLDLDGWFDGLSATSLSNKFVIVWYCIIILLY